MGFGHAYVTRPPKPRISSRLRESAFNSSTSTIGYLKFIGLLAIPCCLDSLMSFAWVSQRERATTRFGPCAVTMLRTRLTRLRCEENLNDGFTLCIFGQIPLATMLSLRTYDDRLVQSIAIRVGKPELRLLYIGQIFPTKPVTYHPPTKCMKRYECDMLPVSRRLSLRGSLGFRINGCTRL